MAHASDVGDVAQLVLQFGEYRGATLFQVVQKDPDYLRSQALTAQRPSGPRLRRCNSCVRSKPANGPQDDPERGLLVRSKDVRDALDL
jgi:hypothetical protein